MTRAPDHNLARFIMLGMYGFVIVVVIALVWFFSPELCRR